MDSGSSSKAFVAHGYVGASLNRILDDAGISKGAAYYYFDDKADLYATAIVYYSQELLGESLHDTARVTADNFGEDIVAIYRQQFTCYAERPWVFGHSPN